MLPAIVTCLCLTAASQTYHDPRVLPELIDAANGAQTYHDPRVLPELVDAANGFRTYHDPRLLAESLFDRSTQKRFRTTESTPSTRPHRISLAILMPGDFGERTVPFPPRREDKAPSMAVRARVALGEARKEERGLARIAVGDKDRRRQALARVVAAYFDVSRDYPGTKASTTAASALARLHAYEDDKGIVHVSGQ